MDFAFFYGLFLIALITGFLSMVIWTYRSKRQDIYNDAAQLPFADEFVDKAKKAKKTNNEVAR